MRQQSYRTGFIASLSMLEGKIAEIPVVDAEPVRHGLWGECRITGYDGLHAVYTRQCSECGHESRFITRYCPVCGARMDAGVKE